MSGFERKKVEYVVTTFVIIATIFLFSFVAMSAFVLFDELEKSAISNSNPTDNTQNNQNNENNIPNMQDLCDKEEPTYNIVESIPYGEINQTLQSPFEKTTQSWHKLITEAEKTIDIACYYMTLRDTETNTDESRWDEAGREEGIMIFNDLIDASNRGVLIRIAQSSPLSPDSIYLRDNGYAEVREVNLTQLAGAGIVHTKFIIADTQNFYVGSANMDWRALTQVKEVGITVTGSECLASDLKQTFEVYWECGVIDAFPTNTYLYTTTSNITCLSCDHITTTTTTTTTTETVVAWPYLYAAYFNLTSPAKINFSNTNSISDVYLTSAPLFLCPPYRTDDIVSVTYTIDTSAEKLKISLMDYVPSSLYSTHNYYWDYVDSSIRNAAYRGVAVQLLISVWDHTPAFIYQYLASLDVLEHIEVKLFKVDAYPGDPIPYTRVNHAKFMVTEKTALITTSNWSADYFENTAGVSFVSNSQNIITDIQSIFDRDWNSQYAFPAISCTNSSFVSN